MLRVHRLLVMLLIMSLLLAACGASTSRATPTPDPFKTFTTVRNSCGVCGTDSPVGGWEAADGRTLILSENGNFVVYFEDDTSMRGEWSLTGSQLCLTTSIGASSCFSYQQKVDAMKLDDAIYVRR